MFYGRLACFAHALDPETIMIEAAKKGDWFVVRALLPAGADIEAKSFYGWTALHWAAAYGHRLVVRDLLAVGADIEAKIGSWTTLHSAALNGHRHVVRELLAAGANINVKTNYGETVLHSAAQNNHLLVVLELLAAGVDIKAKTNYAGGSPSRWPHKMVIFLSFVSGSRPVRTLRRPMV